MDELDAIVDSVLVEQEYQLYDQLLLSNGGEDEEWEEELVPTGRGRGDHQMSSSRFNRVPTATPSSSTTAAAAHTLSSALPRVDGEKRESAARNGSRAAQRSSPELWVDHCIDDVKDLLHDLPSDDEEDEEAFDEHIGSAGPGQRRAAKKQTFSPSPAHGGDESLERQHLRLEDRLGMWGERKEMKRMLLTYSKLMEEQTACTFHPRINHQRVFSSAPAAARSSAPAAATSTIRGYHQYLERMEDARAARDAPEREEAAKQQRYRDPQSFNRHPTIPKPFHFTPSRAPAEAAAPTMGAASSSSSLAPAAASSSGRQPASVPRESSAGLGVPPIPRHRPLPPFPSVRLELPRHGGGGGCGGAAAPKYHHPKMAAAATPPGAMEGSRRPAASTTPRASSVPHGPPSSSSMSAALRSHLFDPEFSLQLRQQRCHF